MAATAGCLPDLWQGIDPRGGRGSRGGVMRPGDVDLVIDLSHPDTFSALCRAIAKRLGHEGKSSYWLAPGSVGTWLLLCSDGQDVRWTRRSFPVRTADPREAAKVIVERLALVSP